MSELLALGISHKTAPVELRERVALPEGRAASVLRELVSTDGHPRGGRALDVQPDRALPGGRRRRRGRDDRARDPRARRPTSAPPSWSPISTRFATSDAARHLFRVTAGLDAMIVGEAEIQGQVKRAYELALVENTTSAFMNRLFREALAAGKRVRTETSDRRGQRLGQLRRGPARAGDARRPERPARGRDRRRRDRRADRARADGARACSSVFVANRHYDRAIGLAQRFGGQAVRFDMLPAELERADIVLSSTGSPHSIVERDELAAVMEARGGRPLLLIDIAVPRDIDPAVADARGRLPRRHRRPPARGRAQPVRPRGRGAARGSAARPRARALPALARDARRRADDRRAARARRGDRAAGAGRERAAAGSRSSDADRERLELVAATIVKRLLQRADPAAEGTRRRPATYAYVQALRELFGLEAESRSAFERRAGASSPKPRRDARRDADQAHAGAQARPP